MPLNNLMEIYILQLAEQLAAEEKYIKATAKVPAAVITDELRSAVSPAATEIENHVSRLSRAGKSCGLKKKAQLTALDKEMLHLLKTVLKGPQSMLKDARTLDALRSLYLLKVARYDALWQMAVAVGQTEYAPLLEQSAKDNQNTVAYLNQIAQNIVYPAALKA